MLLRAMLLPEEEQRINELAEKAVEMAFSRHHSSKEVCDFLEHGIAELCIQAALRDLEKALTELIEKESTEHGET
jgi:hypothetical protein